MEHKIRLIAETDNLGKFTVSEEFVDVASGDVTVHLWLTLVAPTDTKVAGVVDVESGTGSNNAAKRFDVENGERADLGRWELSARTDRVIVTGESTPRRRDSLLRFELIVDV